MTARAWPAVAGATTATVWGLLALTVALGDSVTLWPLMAFVDRGLVASRRRFAPSTGAARSVRQAPRASREG